MYFVICFPYFLCVAVWYKNAPITEYLIKTGADVHVRNTKLQYPIHWACMGGDLHCVRHLINGGASVTVQDKDGNQQVPILQTNGPYVFINFALRVARLYICIFFVAIIRLLSCSCCSTTW